MNTKLFDKLYTMNEEHIYRVTSIVGTIFGLIVGHMINQAAKRTEEQVYEVEEATNDQTSN
jgi:hypothetical protein